MEIIQHYVNQIKNSLDNLPWAEIEETIAGLRQARRQDRQVFIMGSGRKPLSWGCSKSTSPAFTRSKRQ